VPEVPDIPVEKMNLSKESQIFSLKMDTIQALKLRNLVLQKK
jgi:hypothetical protein